MDKVWRERPDIPGWHKALGAVAWMVLVLQPAGWAFLGVTFVTNVLLGRQNPHQWAAWITALGAWIVLGAVVLGIPLLLILLSQEPA